MLKGAKNLLYTLFKATCDPDPAFNGRLAFKAKKEKKKERDRVYTFLFTEVILTCSLV